MAALARAAIPIPPTNNATPPNASNSAVSVSLAACLAARLAARIEQNEQRMA